MLCSRCLLLKSHLLWWLGRWPPNYASYPSQVPMPHFHLSVDTDLNIPPSPQKQHVWNTLNFRLHLKSFTFLFLCMLLPFSLYLRFSSFTFIPKLAYINPVLCFSSKSFTSISSFSFPGQILLPPKLVSHSFEQALNSSCCTFSYIPPKPTYDPNPNSSHSSS